MTRTVQMTRFLILDLTVGRFADAGQKNNRKKAQDTKKKRSEATILRSTPSAAEKRRLKNNQNRKNWTAKKEPTRQWHKTSWPNTGFLSPGPHQQRGQYVSISEKELLHCERSIVIFFLKNAGARRDAPGSYTTEKETLVKGILKRDLHPPELKHWSSRVTNWLRMKGFLGRIKFTTAQHIVQGFFFSSLFSSV